MKTKTAKKVAKQSSSKERYFSLCLAIVAGAIAYALLSIIINSFFQPDGWVNAPGTIVKPHIEWGWVIFWTLISLLVIALGGWLLYNTYKEEGLTLPQQLLMLAGVIILAIDCFRVVFRVLLR